MDSSKRVKSEIENISYDIRESIIIGDESLLININYMNDYILSILNFEKKMDRWNKKVNYFNEIYNIRDYNIRLCYLDYIKYKKLYSIISLYLVK